MNHSFIQSPYLLTSFTPSKVIFHSILPCDPYQDILKGWHHYCTRSFQIFSMNVFETLAKGKIITQFWRCCWADDDERQPRKKKEYIKKKSCLFLVFLWHTAGVTRKTKEECLTEKKIVFPLSQYIEDGRNSIASVFPTVSISF